MLTNNLGYKVLDNDNNDTNDFNNITSSDLDMLARNVNNDIRNKTNKNTIHTIQNMFDADYDVKNNTDQGFYNVQGEYINDKSKRRGTPIMSIINSNNDKISLTSELQLDDDDCSISLDIFDGKKYKHKNNSKFKMDDKHNNKNNDKISHDKISQISYGDIDFELSDKEIELELKSNSNYSTERSSDPYIHRNCIEYDLHSVDTLNSLSSGESLIEHIRDCKTCKNKVLDLIHKNKKKKRKRKKKKRKHIDIEEDTNTNTVIDYNKYVKLKDAIKDNKDNDNNITNINDSKMDSLNGLNYKELILICLVGIIVIFLIDYFFNK